MCGWGVIRDTCGNSINKNLASADIEMGGDACTHIRQRGSNGRGEEVGGSGELVSRRSSPAKTTRFPLGVHLQADTRTLAKVGTEARPSLQTPTRPGAKTLACVLRVMSSM